MKDPRRIMHGIKIHRDTTWNYSFWYPSHWHRFDMDAQYGFIYAPGQDPRTGFHVSAKDLSSSLESPVSQDDLSVLSGGVTAGLRQLPDCDILYEKEITKGYAIGLEVLLTFTMDNLTCKRLMHLLYNDRQQFTLYGQGVPVAEYEVFHDTFDFIYLNFGFGDTLASLGIQAPPSVTVEWQGRCEDVEVAPHSPREH